MVEYQQTSFWRSRTGLTLCVFLTVAVAFLLTEHWAHVLGVLPLILPLGLCLGMHAFMHDGHGGHGQGGHGDHAQHDTPTAKEHDHE
ncbi:hypothetical protein GALL_174080 [mine drainage metagenome]|uniref:DUF2933 domain-containing protein n=1 Tax=mine drainage metagenome TaxID=410659 RepID=A0A1J5RX86_9ZZZZ